MTGQSLKCRAPAISCNRRYLWAFGLQIIAAP